VGTFDTKAAELNDLAGMVRAAGVRVITVDIDAAIGGAGQRGELGRGALSRVF